MKYGIAFDHCHIDHKHHISLIIKIGWVLNIYYKIKRQKRDLITKFIN